MSKNGWDSIIAECYAAAVTRYRDREKEGASVEGFMVLASEDLSRSSDKIELRFNRSFTSGM